MLRARHRVVISAVGITFQRLVLPNAPPSGTIRRVRATIEGAQDASADLGTTAATEIAIRLEEGGGGALPATPVGNDVETSIPFNKPIGTAPVGLTLDIGSGRSADPVLAIDYTVPPGGQLTVAVRTDVDVGAENSGVIAVTVVIEPST